MVFPVINQETDPVPGKGNGLPFADTIVDESQMFTIIIVIQVEPPGSNIVISRYRYVVKF